jgi:hypothetical protein
MAANNNLMERRAYGRDAGYAMARLGLRAALGQPSRMTTTESEILQELVRLDSTVAGMPAEGPRPSILPIVGRLTELTRQLPADTDPTLLHYLHKRSYEKARLFLEGRDAENAEGNCGHV